MPDVDAGLKLLAPRALRGFFLIAVTGGKCEKSGAAKSS